LPALSNDWGVWSQVGAAAQRQVGERVAGQGIGSIDPKTGIAMLEFLMSRNPAHVAAIPIDWTRFLNSLPSGKIPAFLRGWRGRAESGQTGARVEARGAAFWQSFDSAPPGRRAALVLDLVRAEVARVLGLRNDEPIELRQPLTEIGLDSLMAVELRNSLASILQRNLPATVLFDYPSVDALADFLVRELLGSRPSSPERSQAEASFDAQSAARLDDLSEAELADLLAKQLATLSGEK
jgi:acyl carrier protein